MLASVMRRPADLDTPEDDAFAAAIAPPPLADARESLEFWRGRLAGAPLYRFRRRREARQMVARWEARVRRAEAAVFGGGVAGRLRAAWDRGTWAGLGSEVAHLARRRVRLPALRHVVIAAAALWVTVTLATAVVLAALLSSI